jgi:hypothetical protein
VLTEDFGNDRMRDWLDLHPADERAAYEAAVDALARSTACRRGRSRPMTWRSISARRRC